MKRKKVPITAEMIRKYFGQNARITGFAGRFKVRTANGGEIKISQSNIEPIFGGSDVYSACVRLSQEAWGGGQVYGDSAESKLSLLAHGEAEGVNLRVAERGGFGRAFVAGLIFIVGWNVFDLSYPSLLISGVIALVVWLLLKRGAKRQAQREAERLGYTFPRVGSAPRGAAHDDAERKGWL